MKTNTAFYKKRATILACATLAILAFTTANMSQTADLTITIKSIKGNKGNLMIGVGELQNYKSIKGDMARITNETTTVPIKEVAKGAC